MKHLHRLKPLYIQVLIAIALAVAVGLIWPEFARSLKPLGDGFIALLKVLIGPIIFTTVVIGLTTISDLSKLGRVVLKAFIYFEVVSTLALAAGLIVGNIFQPGAGMNASTDISASVEQYRETAEQTGGFVNFVLGIIPETFFSAFNDGQILQILVLAVLFGVGVIMLKGKAPTIVVVIDEAQKIFFKTLGIIMKLAPLGAFGAMAYTVGSFGTSTLISLLQLVLLTYATCIFFVFVVLGGIAAAHGLNIFRILKLIREEILLVLGTSSSEVALPRLLNKMQKAGCEKSVVGLVVPTSYSFNTDGTAIYMSMSVLFISQATNSPLTIAEQLGVLAVLLLTSKGGAAVSGAGFVKLAATLESTPSVPLGGLGLLIGVDRFMSEARAITNLIGTTVATLVISVWEKDFDKGMFLTYSANPVFVDDIDDESGKDTPLAVSAVDTVRPVEESLHLEKSLHNARQ